jgi:glucosamine-phosphate N-acetyltransferase
MSLFDASLLGEASALSSGSLVLRPLCRSDGKRGFVRVLSQLTTVGNYSESQFEQRFDQMCAVNAVFGTYFIVVVEDKSSGKMWLALLHS